MNDFLGLAESIKNIRECMDWLIALPEKLISSWNKTHENIETYSSRLLAYREMAEIREIGKQIQSLYMSKGSIVVFAQSCVDNRWLDDVWQLKHAFMEMEDGLEKIKIILSETHVSQISLSTEAILFLSKAQAGYKELSEISDDTLLNNSDVLILALKYMETLQETGSDLIKRLDEYRIKLDFTYDIRKL